jgi:hypothetical protein
LFLYIWVRWTLPLPVRSAMALGWKVMLPSPWLSGRSPLPSGCCTGWDGRTTRTSLALFGMNVVIGIPLFFGLDRGRLVAGSVTEERA